MRRARLFNKTLIILILVFGIAAVVTSAFSAWTIDRSLTEEYQSKGTAIANSIAGSSTEILLYRDASTIQAMIDQFLEIEGVSYVLVVNPRGEVIAHTFVPQVPEEIRALKADPHETTTQRIKIKGQGDFLDIASPIVAGRAGYVHVGMDEGRIQHFIWSAILRQVGLMSLLFLLSVLAAYFLVNRIAQPLKHLTDYAKSLASGNLETAGQGDPEAIILPIAERTDEVGEMAQAFRHMVLEVSAREQQLRQAHDKLESRVRERTDELVQANGRLQTEMEERRRAQDELCRQAQELARSNAELEQFAYVASHDLQEPLRMVASYLELLSQRYQGKLDAKADRWIGFAMDGAGRMKQLINDLLEFSRVGTRGKLLEPTDCVAVYDAAIANLQKAIQESGAVITRGPLPAIVTDAMQLTQVLQNLISNAIKFRSTRPPEIQVQAERKDDDWLFSVRDNGIGIDPQYFDRIFVIFQRLHTREEYSGTGIGLAVCKKVIERQGGRIWIESQPGQGTTFYFTLPDRKGDSHGAPRLGRPAEILLVEDNPGDVELTREALEDAKVSNNLYVVQDGVEAMAFLRRQGTHASVPRPDLILLDLNLPRKDGREVLAEIKADDNLKVIPVVVLTTSKADEDILKSYKLNANCYVAKPVAFAGFAQVVRSIECFWFSVVVLPPKS